MSDPISLHLLRKVSALIEPVAPYYLKRRAAQGKEHLPRLDERLGYSRTLRPNGALVWIHGASVGEFVSILPLATALVDRGIGVLVTTGTVTSARVAVQRLPNGAFHQYVPIDGPEATRRFIAHWRPDLAIFVESELWPNLIVETARCGITMAIVNGRMSERSAKGWRRAPKLIKALLSRFSICLTQTEEDAIRYRALGASNAVATGNLKFDAQPLPVDADQLDALKSHIGTRPTFIAASTHPGEEEVVIASHLTASRNLPDLMTIIAPRHPDRGQAITALAAAAGLKTARRALGEMPDADTGIYIADTVGEMGLVYRLGRLALVGGSFAPRGGQNPIEPAKLGVAILHGPQVANFAEVYAAFDRDGGALRIDDPDKLGPTVARLLAAPAQLEAMQDSAGGTADGLSGALNRAIQALDPFLPHFLEKVG